MAGLIDPFVDQLFGEKKKKMTRQKSIEQRGAIASPKVDKEMPVTAKGALGGAGAAMKSGSAMEGAMAGAMTGNPMAAVAGGALGLAKGLAGQAREKRRIESEKHKQIGENIKQTSKQKNKAIDNIMEGLRAAFIF